MDQWSVACLLDASIGHVKLSASETFMPVEGIQSTQNHEEIEAALQAACEELNAELKANCYRRTFRIVLRVYSSRVALICQGKANLFRS